MVKNYSLTKISRSIRRKCAFSIALTCIVLLFEVSEYDEKEDFLESIFSIQRKHKVLSKLLEGLKNFQQINTVSGSESSRMTRIDVQALLLEEYVSSILYYTITCE